MAKTSFEDDPIKDSPPVAAAPDSATVLRKLASEREEFINRSSDEQQFESVIETFLRLKHQALTLKEELVGLSQQAVDGGPSVYEQQVPMVNATVREDTENLGKLLRAPSLQPVVEHKNAGSSTVDMRLSSDEVSHSLLEQVKCLTTHAAGKEVTYELYSTPSEQSALLDLDRKLSQFERLIYPSKIASGLAAGVVPLEKASNSTSNSSKEAQPFSSLLTKLNDLQERLNLLTEHKLDHVYRRTKTLLTDMDTVELPSASSQTRRASAIVKDFGGAVATGSDVAAMTSVEKENRLLVIDDLVNSHNSAAASIPFLTSRLASQADYHQAAAKCVQRLQALEQKQAAITYVLECDRTNLSKAQQSLEATAATLNANATSLLARLNRLQ